jgi:hypothetical protein
VKIDNFKKQFRNHLKGADALFYSIAIFLGLKVEMRTVYEVYDDDEVKEMLQEIFDCEEEDVEEHLQSRAFLLDEFSPLKKGVQVDKYRCEDSEYFLTSKVPTHFEGNILPLHCIDSDIEPITRQIVEHCKVRLELPVIWAFKDGKNTETGKYATYFGNQ